MSAIFGLLHLDKRPVTAEELARMGDALAMYGKDGGEQWQQGAVGLGQRLFQVTPEDAFEQQPLMSANSKVYLVCDGRIDNRREVLETLKLSAPATETPDSVLLLHAYERWGRECVRHLIGAFTFALWDEHSRQLMIARSALASPSLFYHASPQTLSFATMPKGLFALPFIAHTIDEEYLADYLARTSTEATGTFYMNVKRLLPGQLLLAQGEKWSVETFWQPELTHTIHFTRDEEYVESFCEIFERVVQDRLRSRTPVGVMMSGGLDSTSIAAVAARFYQTTGKRLATFTEVPCAGFDGAIIDGRYADETPYVQAMARQQPNLDLNLIQTDGQFYLDDADRFFAAAETPFPNAANRVWYEAILQAAQMQGVSVLLEGGGGNLTISWRGDGLLAELVGAGRWTQAWREAQAMTGRKNSLSLFRSLFMGGIMPLMPDWCYLTMKHIRAVGRNEADSLARNWRERSLIHPDFAAAYRVKERACVKGTHLSNRPTKETRSSRLSTLLFGVRRSDGLAAAYQALYGVTLCDPTRDLRLVEFCLALPEEQYQHNGVTRRLIRRAMTDHLPRQVLENKRRGLQAADWYERLYQARGRILDELAHIEQCALARRALDLSRLRAMVEQMTLNGANAKWQMAEYRGILERGLMTGSFIRWVEGRS